MLSAILFGVTLGCGSGNESSASRSGDGGSGGVGTDHGNAGSGNANAQEGASTRTWARFFGLHDTAWEGYTRLAGLRVYETNTDELMVLVESTIDEVDAAWLLQLDSHGASRSEALLANFGIGQIVGHDDRLVHARSVLDGTSFDHLELIQFSGTASPAMRTRFTGYAFRPRALTALVDGDVVAVGDCGDPCAARFTPDGVVAWQATYSGLDADSFSHSATTPRDTIVATGTQRGYRGWVTAELGASGSLLWHANYDLNGQAYAVVATPDGGHAVAGIVWPDETSQEDGNAFVARLDATGNLAWQKEYGSVGSSQRIDWLAAIGEDEIAFLGTHHVDGIPRPWLVQLDRDGTIRWQHLYGSASQSGSAATFTPLRDGGYFLAGVPYDNYHAEGFWIVRTDEEGNVPDADCPVVESTDLEMTDLSITTRPGSDPTEIVRGDLDAATTEEAWSESVSFTGDYCAGLETVWSGGGPGDGCACPDAEQRCMGPDIGCQLGLYCTGTTDLVCSINCRQDDDCPEPMVCQTLTVSETVILGNWCMNP